MTINVNLQPSKHINVELSRAVLGVEKTGGEFTEQEKTSLISNVAGLQANVANISVPDLTPITQRVANVEQTVANIVVPDLASLTSRVTTAENTIVAVQTKNTYQDGAISSLQTAVAQLEAGTVDLSPVYSRIDEVETATDLVDGRVTQTNANVENLTTRVSSVESTNTSQAVQISQLQNDLNNIGAALPLADGTSAGLMAPAQVTKLAGIATGATVNSPDAQLRDRATHTGTQAISTVTGLQAALDGKAALVGGKLDPSQVPDIALQQYLGAVASEAAMLALAGQLGDWCSRSDTGTDWRIVGNPATLAGWLQTAYPSAPVVSVAGRTGGVTLTKADVGLDQVNNTSDANKPVSTAQAAAIAAKMDATLPALQAVFNDGTAAQKAAFSASVSGAAVAQAMTAIIAGDSLGAENGPELSGGFLKTFDTGWFNWLQRFGGRPFELLSNVSVRGKRSDEILSQQIPLILTSSAKVVFMVCPGANDVIQGVPSATTIGFNQQIFDAIIAAGKHIVLLTSFPLFRLTIADNSKFEEIVRHARNYAAWSRGMTLIDARRVLIDPVSATMYAKSGYLRADNTHLTARAARLLGKFAWDELVARGWRSNAYHVSSIADVRATAAGAANRVINPLMTGTGGSLNAGFTGSCPSGMQWYASSGAATGTCSIAARADGYGNNAVGVITAPANAEFTFRTNDLMRNNISAGEVISGEFSVSMSGVSGLRRLMVGLIVNVGGTNYAVYENDFGGNSFTQVDQSDFTDLWCRTPGLSIPAGSVSSVNLVLAGYFEAAGGGTFSIGRAAVF